MIFSISLSNWLLGGAVSVHNAHLLSHSSLPSLSAEFVYVHKGELLHLSLAALEERLPKEFVPFWLSAPKTATMPMHWNPDILYNIL